MQATTKELEIINSRLPAGASVKPGQVEILPFMMFDNKETDRATIMSQEMMKKLVLDLNAGKVAMNSMHQSHSTLPAGRSVSGQLSKNGAVQQVLAKMYVVTQRPDGQAMEDGKDLADRYNTGAVFACSAGVYVGFYKCSICGNDIRDYQACDHFPGEVYKIDEKPVRCIAVMTGHDIQDGAAMDCGAYELSAVTAGGVRDASILTETFGKYQDGADIAEFKKGAFESKEIVEHIAFFPAIEEKSNTEEYSMSLTAEDVKKLVAEQYSPLLEQKAKLELENSQYKATIETLEKAGAEFAAKIAEFEKLVAETTTKVAEFSAQVETLTTELETEKSGHEAFKTAFAAVVEAEGAKVEKTDSYATKSLVELQELYETYKAEVAKLPAGQQSTDEPIAPVDHAYQGIPEGLFKTA